MRVQRFDKNTQGRDIAVGDIHGFVTKFLDQLNAIGFDPSKDRVFSVGDLVDRGPESRRVDELLAMHWFHAVQGNHEDFAIRYPKGHMDAFLYGANGGQWNVSLSHEENVRYSELLGSLPVAIEVETENGKVGIVHADCPYADWWRFTRELEDEDSSNNVIRNVRELCMWDRTRWQNKDETPVIGVRAVVVGHTPMDNPLILGNVYHIDTKGWKGGNFTFLDLATLDIIK